MKSMVRWQRAFSSAKLVSVSGIEGASIPVSRATADLAVSDDIWIWPENGLMSGASRASTSAFSSLPSATALSIQACILVRAAVNTGADAW